MPPKKPSPDQNPDQGAFFEAVTEHYGEVTSTRLETPEDGVAYAKTPPPFEPPKSPAVPAPEMPEAIDIKEYLESQLEALKYLGKISRKQGLSAKAATDPEYFATRRGRKYGSEALGSLLKESDFSRTGDGRLALQEFARSYGGRAFSNTIGNKTLLELDPDFAASYRQFLRRYQGPGEAAKRRTSQMRKFGRVLAAFEDPSITLRFNPAKVPVEIVKPAPKEEPATVIELPQLTTTQKVEAVHGDRRSGFMPMTNREKTEALELLNYLKPDNQAGGVHDHFMKIYDGQVKQGRRLKVRDPVIEGETPPEERKLPMNEAKAIAGDTIRSKLYEYGDYRQNAGESIKSLTALEAALATYDNPNISLAELLSEQSEALDPRALVRYLDNKEFHTLTVEEQALRRTMVTLEDRTDPTPEKHKTVEDRYTRADMDEMMAIYIELRLRNLKVGDVRDKIGDAVQDQHYRRAFWGFVLSNVRYTYRPIAEQVLAATN